MPRGLRRIHDCPHLHYITCSCYRRAPLLAAGRARDTFVRILEQVRRQFRFLVIGFVVMPEHFHLLMSKPEVGNPSKAMHLLKQRVATRLLPKRKRRKAAQRQIWEDTEAGERHLWQARFYDFNVYSEKKRIEKLKYMHRNPVKRGLVSKPEMWKWSSYRYYAFGEQGAVTIQRVGDRPATQPKFEGPSRAKAGRDRNPPSSESAQKRRRLRREWGTHRLAATGRAIVVAVETRRPVSAGASEST